MPAALRPACICRIDLMRSDNPTLATAHVHVDVRALDDDTDAVLGARGFVLVVEVPIANLAGALAGGTLVRGHEGWPSSLELPAGLAVPSSTD